MRNSGVRIDHVAGDRAYYNKVEDRVVLPERSQFPTQDAYTHTALHELGHATGHPSRLDRSTLTKHGGFGSETYAREELRAEIAAMMSGEKLGVGHEPRHGTAYVASWVQALKDDQRARSGRRASMRSAHRTGCCRGSGNGSSSRKRKRRARPPVIGKARRGRRHGRWCQRLLSYCRPA